MLDIVYQPWYYHLRRFGREKLTGKGLRCLQEDNTISNAP